MEIEKYVKVEYMREVAERRLELLRRSKAVSKAALRSLHVIGHAGYVPTMNRLEALIDELEEELGSDS